MKKFFSIVAAALFSMSMFAIDPVTIDFTANPLSLEAYSQQNPITITNGNVTVTFNKGTATVDPRIDLNHMRVYKNSNFVVSDNTNNIKSIIFTETSASYSTSNLSTTTGTYTNPVWTGDAASVQFTAGNQVRLDKIVVYYETQDAPQGPDTIVATIAEINAAQAQELNTTDYFQTTGTVGAILSAEYGNYFLYDGNDSVKVYGTLDADGKARNFASLGINEGDEITVLGKMKMFNEELEFVDVKVLSGAKTPTLDTLTVAEAMTKGQALADGGESEKVCVIGYIVKAYAYGEKFAGAQTGYMADQVGAFGEFQLYNCNVPAPGFAEGDKVAVVGKITKYVSADGTKTTIEIKSGDVEVISAAAIEDIESAAKATKVIENGQMVIIRNGVRFNAAGARL